jgi:NhaA family Na+:H+ antiporter
MVFFFGIAAKEITESALPGGSLNPLRKSINPLLATLGGVVGPVAVFFIGLSLIYGAPGDDIATLSRGWGIPTATDIALAWLVARTVFGAGHPAVDFLLLLAVADDAIGLVIIAVFYGDPSLPAQPQFLLLILVGMAIAYGLRRARVVSWVPYIAVGGPLAWLGLSLAHLHPALALVFIVPFLPGPHRDTGMFRGIDEVDEMGEVRAEALHAEHSPLHEFESQLKLFVDFGLFFFAFTNAGVELASIGAMTWLILGSLVIGKTVGVGGIGWLAIRIGFPLPDGMAMKDLFMAGFVAALGLTVALFVAGAAFVDPVLLGQAKMGALFSGFVGLLAIAIGRALGFGRR